MSARVLVGSDPRRIEPGPINLGLTMARLTGARLVIAAVQAGLPAPIMLSAAEEHTPYATGVIHDDLLADCGPAIEQIESEARAWDIPVECIRLQGTSAARALHEEAEREPPALLVVGSGGTAERLLHGAACPVAVTPRTWVSDGRLGTIGVAFVDSDEGRAALEAAAALAHRTGASLLVLNVVRDEFVDPQTRRRAEEALRAAAAEAVGEGSFDVDILAGDPAERLLLASAELDVLVCGARGYGPLRAVLLGSVSRRVAASARCPVLVLPRGVAAPLGALVSESPRAAAT
jgi:nucleotide-binding universal stress UspA family protein